MFYNYTAKASMIFVLTLQFAMKIIIELNKYPYSMDRVPVPTIQYINLIIQYLDRLRAHNFKGI
jgi:hypothetical protein